MALKGLGGHGGERIWKGYHWEKANSIFPPRICKVRCNAVALTRTKGIWNTVSFPATIIVDTLADIGALGRLAKSSQGDIFFFERATLSSKMRGEDYDALFVHDSAARPQCLLCFGR